MIRRKQPATRPTSRENCPLIKAAMRTGSLTVLAAALRWHPPSRCPAARREATRAR